MNKGLTVAELYEACKYEMSKGNGNKHIQISDDDEGNGFHSLFYLFDDKQETLDLYEEECMLPYGIKASDNIIMLG